MANQTNTTDDRELDLGKVSRKMKAYIVRVNDSLFDIVLFVKKYWIVLILLIVAGVLLGIRGEKAASYEHRIIVQPNFGSTDYLYNEVEMIANKLKQKDTTFLRSTGINNSQKLGKVIVEPVVDIYSFMTDPAMTTEDNDRKFQVFRIIAEGGDIEKTVENEMTSKDYKYHLITISTNKPGTREEIVKPVMDYLNANPYYKKMKEEYLKSLDLRIVANDTTIKQIDGILNDFSKNTAGGAGLVFKDNTSLNEVIEMKNELIREQDRNRLDKINFTDIMTDRGTIMNVKVYSFIGSLMKYIYPVLFVMLFAALMQFRHYYKKQVEKRKIVITNE